MPLTQFVVAAAISFAPLKVMVRMLLITCKFHFKRRLHHFELAVFLSIPGLYQKQIIVYNAHLRVYASIWLKSHLYVHSTGELYTLPTHRRDYPD